MPFRDAPFPPLRSVGTDIVDLADPRCAEKAGDARFLVRVLTEAERNAVAAAPREGGPGRGVSPADLLLWRIWALKEAAFKTITGVLGSPPVFEHRAFAVRFDGEVEGGGEGDRSECDGVPLDAVVRWRGRLVHGRIVDAGAAGPVHAVARGGPPEGPTFRGVDTPGEPDGSAWSRARLRWGRAHSPEEAGVPWDRFTERELRPIHSPASARVRLHARRDLAEWAGVSERDVEIVCDEGPTGRMPPRVLVRGRERRCPLRGGSELESLR